MTEQNDGIRIDRSTVISSSLAAGRGARASIGAGHADELGRLLRRLSEAVARSREELERPEEIEEAATTLAAELTKPRLNPITVNGLLDGIARAASTATAVVESVRAIGDFVQRAST